MHLPAEALEGILAVLDPASRGRAACVCREWRAAAAHPAVWRSLTFLTEQRSAAALRAAAARAEGGLQELRMLGPVACWAAPGTEAALLELVRANRGALRLLHFNSMPVCVLERLLNSTRPATLIKADCVTSWFGVPVALLLRAPPFDRISTGALSLRYVPDAHALGPSLQALRRYEGLRLLALCARWTAETLAPVAALPTAAAGLGDLSLSYSTFGPGCGPILARLLCGKLTRLDLGACLLGDEDLRPLLRPLARDASLRALDLRWNCTSADFELGELLPAAQACASLARLRLACACPPEAPACYQCARQIESGRRQAEAAFRKSRGPSETTSPPRGRAPQRPAPSPAPPAAPLPEWRG